MTIAQTQPKVSNHIATATDEAAFAHWPDGVYEDMKANEFNPYGGPGAQIFLQRRDQGC